MILFYHTVISMIGSLGRWLDNAVWAILFLLLIPSSFVIVSWNSLPDSQLYRMRLAMENVLLAIAPTHEAKGQLFVSFTQRYVRDATQVLSDSGSTVGLTSLNTHVLAAHDNIQNAPDPQVRVELAKKYITTLKEVNVTLEQQKQVSASMPVSEAAERVSPTMRATVSRPPLATGSIADSAPSQNPSPSSTPKPTIVNIPPTASSSQEDPVRAISQTQDTINDVIQDLEEIAQNTSSSQGENGEGDDNREKNDDRDRGRDTQRPDDKNRNSRYR